MKKQVFGMAAALFALMLALFAGAYATDTDAAEPDAPTDTDAAELSAASDVYAILYEDGTLVFQNSNTPETGRAVTKTYPVDLTAAYKYNTVPWYNERESVRVVSFVDKVSPTSTAWWFYNCKNLMRIDNIQNLDTANVTDMLAMFSDCSGLTALDVSHFDTANVTSMDFMFSDCRRLTALDVSKFDTAKVTGMSSMFSGCSGLTALDVSKFNTSNVTGMDNMFCWCIRLTALDVSKFDTAKVTYMGGMFDGCSGLTALDVSKFDTANVEEMSEMFEGCSGLTALDVSKFDTAKVRGMDSMFRGCSGLTALDVSKFDTANVTDTLFSIGMRGMFGSCSGLTVLDLSHFDTAKVTDMEGMFYGCANLKTIYVSEKFTTASVPETESRRSRNMFSGCKSLVGGNGTTYDESHTDKEYARIDTASAPGYFTDKNTPAPVAYAITSVTTENGKLSVTLTNPGPATLAVSYFDANGKFVTVTLQSVQANAGTLALDILTGAATLRVMLLDSDFRPVGRL